jgi:2-dehydropantoate 2-reductase
MKRKEIAIVGIGAMGSLLAARLAPLTNVTLLGHWQPQLAALARDGLTLIEQDGREQHTMVRVTNDPRAVPRSEVALIVVKSYQTARAAPEAAVTMRNQGIAITLQNGLGNLEILRASVGVERAALGTTTEGATLVRPGIVRHAGKGQTYLAHDPRLPAGALSQVAVLFEEAGLTTRLVDDVDSVVWGKLAVNAAINPITALLDVRNGVLAESEPARAVMMLAASEVATVAAAMGIPLPFPDAAARALQVAEATRENISSMLQDIRNGRPTEIEAITGAVVRAAEKVNVPVPVNTALLQLMREREKGIPWQAALAGLPPQRPAVFGRLVKQATEEKK